MVTTAADAQKVRKQRGQRVQILRSMLRLTIEKFAELTGYTRTTIINWEQGQLNGLTDKGARAIVTAVNSKQLVCDLGWLLHGQGMPPQLLSENNYIAQYQRDLVKLASGTGNESDVFHSEIVQFQAFYPNAITMSVQDEGMEPVFLIGDVVGGKRTHGEGIKKLFNNICIIQTANNQLLLRKLLPDESDFTKFKLCCINTQAVSIPPIMTKVEVVSAAPLLRLWREEK